MIKIFRYSIVLIFILSFLKGACQINENIQSWTNHVSYGDYTQAIAAGTVTMTQCIVANAASATGTCSAGRIQMNSSSGIVELPNLSSVGTVEVHLAAGAAGRTLKLQYYDGSTWQDLTTFTEIGTIGATYTYSYNTSNSTTLRLSSPSAAVYVHDIIITLYTGPSINVSPASLTSFNYNLGAGPSSEQSFTISGSNLTDDIILTPPTDYEISTTSGSGFVANPSTITLTQSGGNVSNTTIYVRLKAGLSAGNYNSENISCTSTGATTRNVTCSGTVYTPTLTVSLATLTGFTYVVTNGPSANQTFTISGNYLTSNVTLSAPTDYEISTSSGSGFGSLLTLTPTSGTLSSTTIYVRLKAGLAIGTYNSEVINCTATNATTKTVTCSGTVTASNLSDVIAVSGSEATSVSSIINTAGPLTASDGTQVWQFTIRDGGASGDVDNLPTIVTGIIISNLNSSGLDWSTAIESIDLFDGLTNIASLQYGNANLTNSQANFTGLNINVSDNGSKTITVRLSVRCPLGSGNGDGDYFRLSISNTNFTTESSATSSQKASFTAASSSSTTPRNDIAVVASQLFFSQQPTSTPVNSTMVPDVTVSATDICGNVDKDFSGTVSLTSTGTMTGSPLTATASSGVATFSGIIHTVVETGLTMTASSSGLTSATSSTFNIYLVTVFQPGDFAVISVCSNTSCQGDAAGDDQISFMIFKDINPGDVFIITDNGYERENANKWGNTEGTYQITRTTSSITAGTIITIKLHNSSPYFEGIYPDNNWTMANIGFAGTSCVLNSGGDQLYFMQGGTWNKGTSSGSHDATYTPGVYLYAFNTNSSWTSFAASTQQSGLITSMECFNMMPGVATDYIEYTGPKTPATKRDWILRLNTPSNWTGRTDCATYFSYNIHQGQTYSILSSGYSDGIWVGDKSIDWFDCANWQSLKVPDYTVNVQIPSTGVTNEPTIGDPPTAPIAYVGAECNDIDVQTSRTLTMNHANSRLDVYGNITINGTLSATNGVVNILDDNSTLTSTADVTFYNLTLNKTAHSNTFTINSNINMNNTLTLTSGILTTGTNTVIENNTSLSSITGYGTNSYINGNLRRYVSSTGLYYFPVGTLNYYEQASINLNSSSGLSYLDAKFTNPHSTSIDISPLNITVNGSILQELLNYGFWTITPDAGTYNYDVSLTSRGHTNAGTTAAAHAVVKRPNSTIDWSSEGIHNNADQTMGSDWVTAQRKSLTAFSDFAIAKSTIGPLPVELVDFSAEKVGGKVLLKWSTASETNLNHYSIEKSVNNMVDFTEIATKEGFGNSNTIKNYQLEDNIVSQGISYYRLIEYDNDGLKKELAYTYLNNQENENLLINIVNVSSNQLIADVFNVQGTELFVQIYDMNGILIHEKSMAVDENAFRIKIPFNSNGLFIINVTDGVSSVHQKVILY